MLEVFARTGGTPTAIKAGRLTKEPPPASAFIAPANIPAVKIKMTESMKAMIGTVSHSHNLAIPMLDFGDSEC